MPRSSNNEAPTSGDDLIGRKILEILSSSSDLSCLSMELRNRTSDTDVLYHLSPRRSNLLRPMSGILKGKILEIGAGYGATTRFLGESGAKVISVEENPHRASVARERTRDLQNVEVVGDIQSISIQERFDVITLIGLEFYANIFNNAPLSKVELLSYLKEKLSPGGTLIIAAQNKLGLKYFAGAPEDNSSIPFYGINDLDNENGASALARAELQQTLHSAGFHHCNWLYPFPDHNIPTTILTETALRDHGRHDLSELFADSNFSDPKGARPGTFSLDRAWRLAARNGLTEDLANSFLIACHTSGDSSHAPVTSPEALAWHYSVARYRGFSKQAVFERGAKAGLVVKRSLLAAAPPPDLPIRLILDDEDFISGHLWSAELNRLMNRPGWTSEELGGWLQFWIAAVLAAAGSDPGANPQTAEIPGRFLDAMPFNLVRTPAGTAHFIDLEWESKLPLNMQQLSYQALSKSLGRVTSCAAPAETRHVVNVILIRDVMRHVGVDIDFRSMRDFEWEDRKVHNMVQYGAVGGIRPSFFKFYLRTLKIRSRGEGGIADQAVRWVRKALAAVR